MTRTINLLRLMLTIAYLFMGAVLFKSFYRDFSIIDSSIQNILPLLGGSCLIALGIDQGIRTVYSIYQDIRNS